MKHSIIKSIAAVIASAGILSAEAVPAYPKPITVMQPDGTCVTVRLRGDERLNWMETTDGYTLLRDGAGFITFAKTDRNGFLAPSSLRYDGSSARAKAEGIVPGLRFNADQRRAAMQRHAPTSRKTAMKAGAPQTDFMVDASFPTTGKRKLLVLLVNFSDTETSYTQQQFDDMMNKEGYGGIGSFRDYYKQQSYGQLDIDVTVTDWIKLPKTKGNYGPDGAPYIIYDALSIASQTIDLSQFDNDGDGILDGLAVIHQGAGQEMSGKSEDIWSHSSTIYGQTFNGISVRRYTIEPEILAKDNRMATIGVICHEFGHALGAPDFYDTDYSASGGEYCGTGVWDLLGSGAWLGDYGDRPSGINGWQKYIFGWVNPVTLDESTVVTDMPAADAEPVAYRMETGLPGDYFYMENRQQTGCFDASLPGHGLVVYHVNEGLIRAGLSTNDFNAGFPQGIYTVCSSAAAEPDNNASSYGNVNSAAAPFPGSGSIKEFSDRTLPSTHSKDGRFAYRSISGITDADGKVGFTFTREAEPPKPASLKATTASGSVMLSWQKPENAETPVYYTVYRNNTMIGTTSQTAYTDEKPEGGKLLTYQVDASYESNLISHPSQVKIMVPANRVTGVTATVTGQDVKIDWTTDNRLMWAANDMGKLTQQDVKADVVAYANRFSAENLATYVGGKITRMGFLPMQGPSEIAVNLKIYEADAGSTDATLVSERAAKEFANGQLRDLKLTQPVTIKSGKDYWVAVECRATKGVVTVACDKNAVVDGFGNCLITDGRPTTLPDATGNFYVSATVTMPADATASDILTNPDEDADPAFDFWFPKGYAVFWDNGVVARTTGRSALIRNAATGTHIYKVASLFRGDNMSGSMTGEVSVGTSAINSAGASGSSTAIMIDGCQGEISVKGFSGKVKVTDLYGNILAHAQCSGSMSIAMQPGIYVVTLTNAATRYTRKITVY